MYITIIIILSIVIFILLILFYLLNKKTKKNAYKKGADDFFKLILESGFAKRVEDFKGYNKTANKNKIVFVGDSITEQYNVYEFFKGYEVYNRGIGGDTTVGLAKRLNESIYDLEPNIIFLLIGTNDFGLVENTTSLTLAERINLLVQEIHEKLPNTKIVLESIYPVHEKDGAKIDRLSVSSRSNKQINATNKLLSKIKNCTYLDLNQKLKDKDGDIKYEYTVEGLHINVLGYEVITKNLIKCIKE